MSMLSEFKEFAVKGNVVDLAVGLIIGAEFGKLLILVTDVITSQMSKCRIYRRRTTASPWRSSPAATTCG